MKNSRPDPTAEELLAQAARRTENYKPAAVRAVQCCPMTDHRRRHGLESGGGM